MIDARLRPIREQMGATYGVSVYYEGVRGTDLMIIDASLDRARAGEAIARILRELGGLHDRGETFRVDFAQARRAALRQALTDASGAHGAADGVEMLASRAMPIDLLASRPAQIAALRPEDVAAIFAADLDSTRRVVFVRGIDAKAAAESAGLTDLSVLTASSQAAEATHDGWLDEL